MLLRKRVIKVLDCVRLQTFKRDIAERRPQIQLSLPFVEIRCGILDADLIVFQPNIKPFTVILQGSWYVPLSISAVIAVSFCRTSFCVLP